MKHLLIFVALLYSSQALPLPKLNVPVTTAPKVPTPNLVAKPTGNSLPTTPPKGFSKIPSVPKNTTVVPPKVPILDKKTKNNLTVFFPPKKVAKPTIPMQPGYKGEKGVPYFTPEQQKLLTAEMKDGKIWTLDPDTVKKVPLQTDDQPVIAVLTPKGDLIVLPPEARFREMGADNRFGKPDSLPRSEEYHHSSLANGEDVVWAGTLASNRKGEIIYFDNGSGHYMPPPSSNHALLDYLKSHNVNITGITIGNEIGAF